MRTIIDIPEIIWVSTFWHLIVGVTLLITDDSEASSYVSGLLGIFIFLNPTTLAAVLLFSSLAAVVGILFHHTHGLAIFLVVQQFLLILTFINVMTIMVTGTTPEVGVLPRGLIIPGLSLGALVALGYSASLWRYFILSQKGNAG